MEKKEKRFYYYKQCTINLIKHDIILCFLFVIDYITVYSNIILTIAKIIDATYIELNSPIFYLSPYNIFKHYVGANQTVSICIILVSIIFAIIYMAFYYTLNEETVEPTNPIRITIYKIISNFYELFVFRILAIFIYDSIITLLIQIINTCYNQASINVNILLFIINLLYFGIVFFWHLYSFRNVCVWSNLFFFQGILTYFPFDINTSSKFDLSLLLAKIIIIINQNLPLYPELPYSSDAIFFFSIIFELIIVLNFCYIIYDLFIHKTNFLYYQFHKSNQLRIFLTLFSGSSIVIKLLIFQNYYYVFYPVIILVLIGEILIFVLYFIEHIITRVVKSDDYLGVIYFNLANNINISTTICQWFIHHRLSCKNKLCSICCKLSLPINSSKGNITDDQTKEYPNFNTIGIVNSIHWLWEEVAIQLRTKKNLSINYIYCVECMEIIEFFLTGRHQRIIFYMAFYKAFKKYEDRHAIFYNNLLIMFDFIKKLNTDFLNSYAQFKKTEALTQLIANYLDDFETFLLYSIKTPENVIKIAEKYDLLIKNKQVLTFFPNSIQEYNYQQIIVRHIYELITKNTLPDAHEFDVTTLFDFIDLHFRNDQIVLIKYSFKANSSYIIKAGGAIKNNINKPLESIFPNKIKMIGLSLFLELLHNNDFKSEKNIFEFVVKHSSDLQSLYTESFCMKYVLYPSIETDEIMIVGSFNIGYNDVIIFESNERKDSNLYSFSKRFEKYFGFPPSIIQNLKTNGKPFPFNKIFKKKNIKDDNDSTYSFQFCIFISLLNDYIDETVEVYEDFYERINRIRQVGNSNPDKPFVLENKFTITAENSTYIIYFVQSEQITEEETKNEKSNSLKVTLFQPQIINFQNTCFDNVSMSCSSSVTSHTSHSYTKIQMKKVAAIEKSGFKSINRFVRSITAFSLLLIVLCLIFLVLEIEYNQNFQTLFFLFQKFKAFKRGIDLQPLRLFSNLCVEIDEYDHEAGCVNNYYLYSKKFQKEHTEMASVELINEIVYEDFKITIENLKQLLVEFQTEIFDLNIDELNIINDYTFDMISLVADDHDNAQILSTNYSFFNGINLYYNYISQIINNDELKSLPIRFLDFDAKTMQIGSGTLKISHINQDQKNIYQIILNYPFIHRALLYCEGSIEDGFEKYIVNLERVLILFTVMLMVFHCVLLFICVQFIKNYKNVINEDYCKVISILSSPIYQSYINEEIDSIRVLFQLYDEKPSALASKIYENREAYKKHKKEESKQLQQATYSQSANNNNSNSLPKNSANNKIYDTIVSPFQRIVVINFIAYCIFFVFIFVTMFFALNEIKYLVEYTSINSAIDNYVFDNLNANQYLILSNVTGYELSEFIYDNKSIHYIREGLTKHFYYLEQLEIFIQKHSDYHLISDKINFTCDNMKLLKDQNIEQIENSDGTSYKDLTPFLTGLCNSSPIMNYSSEIIVQREICYTLRKLGYYSTKAFFEEKVLYLTDKNIYDLYNLVLILNKLLRAYVNNELLPERVYSISTRFRLSVICCLVINCIFEISIVAILLFFVMRKMIDLNKIFTQFMKFLD